MKIVYTEKDVQRLRALLSDASVTPFVHDLLASICDVLQPDGGELDEEFLRTVGQECYMRGLLHSVLDDQLTLAEGGFGEDDIPRVLN